MCFGTDLFNLNTLMNSSVILEGYDSSYKTLIIWWWINATESIIHWWSLCMNCKGHLMILDGKSPWKPWFVWKTILTFWGPVTFSGPTFCLNVQRVAPWKIRTLKPKNGGGLVILGRFSFKVPASQFKVEFFYFYLFRMEDNFPVQLGDFWGFSPSIVHWT